VSGLIISGDGKTLILRHRHNTPLKAGTIGNSDIADRYNLFLQVFIF